MAATGIFIGGGAIAQVVWPPSGVRGKASVKGLGTKSPRRCTSYPILFTDFDHRNVQDLKISHNSTPDS